MPKTSRPKKLSVNAAEGEFSLKVYDPDIQWVNADTEEPVDTPPDAEALFYRQAIIEGAKRKYAEYNIAADDPYAKDKLLEALCAEKWEEFKIPKFELTEGHRNNIEAWNRVDAQRISFYSLQLN